MNSRLRFIILKGVNFNEKDIEDRLILAEEIHSVIDFLRNYRSDIEFFFSELLIDIQQPHGGNWLGIAIFVFYRNIDRTYLRSTAAQVSFQSPSFIS